MASNQLDEKAIFNAARRIDSLQARADYLQQACGTNGTLCDRVTALLRGFEEQQSFLETPPVGSDPTIDQLIAARPGQTIGPYKLLQEIGEGGFGVVYLAEQRHGHAA